MRVVTACGIYDEFVRRIGSVHTHGTQSSLVELKLLIKGQQTPERCADCLAVVCYTAT